MTAVRDLPASGWQTIARTTVLGKSRVQVRCDGCKSSSWHYVWSWAGHEVARCGSGKHALRWSAPGHCDSPKAATDHRDARRFRRGVDHRLCICGECHIGAVVDFDRALDKFVENGSDRVYRCGCCLRLVPWCLGGDDESPDVCDDCYALLKRRDVTRWARWEKRVGEGPLPKYAATAAFSRLGLLRQAGDDGMLYPTGLGSRVIRIHAEASTVVAILSDLESLIHGSPDKEE